ncbi:NAD-dependent epimerase/dehydratase family protein [Lipingzhangella sp. LS1_29]|uniref:NAD-dependent epimerase/dehydratase family protein n=1 Tax=Lipingzhangella rawalii TaxID=2055835 RepID=A0ABU2HBE7_9ACTN|nr:NAD-dependent epimerase/dehydratase family protein [Lipingzhangella rawalii]MDS1271909.1 NAD-dependent epimerase/dehydratase family protein [Lipingzhangella rawalii]
MSRVVLVTGVSRHLGARIANALQADRRVRRVIGVDVNGEPDAPGTPQVSGAAPRQPLDVDSVEYVDLHDGTISSVVRDIEPDTVLDLGLTVPATPAGRSRGAGPARLGTMQLLAACQQAPSVHRLVVGTASAAGVLAVAAPHGSRTRGPDRPGGDMVEDPGDERGGVAGHVAGLVRRRPDIDVATVRLANVIGPSTESPLTRYLGMPVVPTVRGYDPRMQFLHEDDMVEAMCRMTLSSCTGCFDAAAPGTVPLSLCLRWAGRSQRPLRERRLRLPTPLRRLGGRRGSHSYSPEQVRRLCPGGVLNESDLERALGWRPRYTSVEAFASFVSTQAEQRPEPRSTH